MSGAFQREESQYWLSVREIGARHNEVVLVLHTGIGQGQSWTKLRIPPHTAMESVLRRGTQRQVILVGTVHGQILEYAPEVLVDGHGATLQDERPAILVGTASLGTTTSFQYAAGGFDVIGAGLRGTTVLINGVLRTIERNTTTTIYWREPLAAAATGTFLIGGYEAWWTSTWMAPQKYGQFLEAKSIDLDFAPSDTVLTVLNQTAIGTGAGVTTTTRAFPVAGAESREVSLAAGYTDQPLPVNTVRHGRYFRVRFGTSGHRNPWAVTGFGLRYDDTGIRGRP
jgi:hypothetical protein